MVVQAAPKTQPGGVQGALLMVWYQSLETPLPVNCPPMASAKKFKVKNIIVLRIKKGLLQMYNNPFC